MAYLARAVERAMKIQEVIFTLVLLWRCSEVLRSPARRRRTPSPRPRSAWGAVRFTRWVSAGRGSAPTSARSGGRPKAAHLSRPAGVVPERLEAG